MKQVQVWVTTEDDTASEEDVANELHSLVIQAAEAFCPILSVDSAPLLELASSEKPRFETLFLEV